MANECGATQAVVPTGGAGKRMGLSYPKALVRLGENTLLDRCVNMLVACGFRNFVFLLGHGDTQVTEHIEKSKWESISIVKSYDYAAEIGMGKAIKSAIVSGKINSGERSIMVWPDDVFLDPKLPEKALEGHLSAVRKFNVVASDVMETAHRYPYGTAKIDPNGIITEFEEKPLVQLPTSVGMRIFEPESYRYFLDLIDLEEKGPVGFETTVLPKLARERKIYAVRVPPDMWISVNTIKELEQAQKLVETGKLSRS